MNPIQSATQAIQGLSPSQAPAALAVNTAMSPQVNAQGFAPGSTGTPAYLSPETSDLNRIAAAQQANIGASLAGNVAGGQANLQSQNNYYNWQQQHMNALAKLSIDQQLNNPQAWQRTKSSDGGFNFTDPTGKPTTAWKYAQVTGQDVGAVLKGSTNPTDQQYLKDESDLNNISNAWYSQDPTKMDSAAKAVGFKDSKDMQKVLQQQGIYTPQDLWKQFMQSYPNVWGSGQGTSVGNQRSIGNFGQQQNPPTTFFSGG